MTAGSRSLQYDMLDIVREGQVEWLTLNRPDRLNALDDRMIEELLGYFAAVANDHALRIIILRGAGQHFCAGLDLKADIGFAADSKMGGPGIGLIRQRRISEIVMRMRRAPQPIICLPHGAACGGGFALVLASDIRIAGSSLRMNAAFTRVGLSGCDIGVSYFLPRLVGSAIASELLLTGRFIDARRAERVGLVSEVVADDQLANAAKVYIDEMLAVTPLGLRLTKECLAMSIDAGGMEAVVAMEDRNQILCTQTDDAKEALDAFREKRRPVYRDK